MAVPLVAEVDQKPVAGLFIFRFGTQAYYLYGMSSTEHRKMMPNHLLQWEAIRWAKAHGCRTYDLWGAPDNFHEKDPLWGVYRFKRGFSGVVVQHIGAWDRPFQPNLYLPLFTLFDHLLCAVVVNLYVLATLAAGPIAPFLLNLVAILPLIGHKAI